MPEEPTFSDDVFGVIRDPSVVEDSLEACIKRWMPTYLRFVERARGKKPKAYPNIRSFRFADTMEERFPEQQIPAVQIMIAENAMIDIEGSSGAITYTGTIDVLCSGPSPETARRNAQTYAFLLGLLLEQQAARQTLVDGSVPINGFGWEKLGVPAIGKPDNRWLAVGSIDITTRVEDSFEPFGGPTVPTEETPEDFPVAETHHVKLTGEAP
jgi:hypothetical protein